jgi:ribulose-5-phosphate 4-epimerase/fuculose-1-phosphate aldolase
MPSTRMSEAEWQTRVDLAACYRLVDLFGWSDLINTRITARVPGPDDHFLINPYGLLFEEITASSLVKIDADGKKVEASEAEVNSGGFAMPSTVHKARPEIACVLHTHSIAGCAVSMQRDGLLPLNQHALQLTATSHITTTRAPAETQKNDHASSPISVIATSWSCAIMVC